jgi:DASS family divalent anion:Na+ symporter
MTDNKARQKVLTSHPLFAGCSPLDLARLLPHVREKQLESGAVLFTNGDPADFLYILARGALRYSIRGLETGNPTVLGEETVLGLKGYLGEAMAIDDCRLWSLPRRQLATLVKECPGVRDRATASLAARINGEPLPAPTMVTPRTGGSWRELIGWLLSTLTPLLVLYSLRHDPLLPALHSRYYLAILSSVAVMWMFRLLPDFIPVLFALLALIIFGVAPPNTILSGFGSDSFFMALSVLGLGTVIRASGLGFRLLLLMIGFRPHSRWWHNFCVFMVGLILTPIIPTANGRISIVSSFVPELIGDGAKERRLRESGRLSISALTGASAFSAIFLSSKSINFLMFGYLPAQEQLRFQWTYWLVAASVTGLALLALYFALWSVVFRARTPAPLSRATIRAQLATLGPLAPPELAALGGILVFAASLATSAIHRIEVPWIALSILFGLLMFGFLKDKDFRRDIDWGFLFYLGGLTGMVTTMKEVGVDQWLTVHCAWLNQYMLHNMYLFIALLAGVLFLVRLVLPINAASVIFLTLLMPTAVAGGVNPWLIGFMVLFLAESYFLPYQASYYLQYCSLTGYGYPEQDKRLVPFNLAITAMKVAALYISLPWWHYLGLL